MAELLAFTPDWKPGIVERWGFLTDVQVSWDGTELRIKLRAVPRIDLEFEVFAAGTDVSGLSAWLDANQADEIIVPYWPSRRHLGAVSAGDTALPVATANRGYAVGQSVVLVDELGWAAYAVSGVSSGAISISGALARNWTGNAVVLPGFTARFLEPVATRRPMPGLVRATIKARLIGAPSAPSAAVPQSGGIDLLTAPAPDWAEPMPDEWRRLLEVLDYQTGPIDVRDRSGFGRRRWSLNYLFAGDEIDVGRTFVWRRAGRLSSALFATPENDTALGRIDGDELEWRWISPDLCRIAFGVQTLPDEV